MVKYEQLLDETPYSILTLAIRSPITRDKYLQRLGYFFDYLDIKDNTIEKRCNKFGAMAKEDGNWLANNISKYLLFHRTRVEKKEITGATLRNYVKPIKLLCEQMDIQIPWKKILRGMPKGRRYGNDRAPTVDELIKLSGYPDRRIKPIVYTMVSSGIRLGAWDYLKFRDVSPITQNGKVVAAKIVVYSGEEEEYISFISPAAWESLSEFKNYRIECGESVDENSWLVRNLWDVTTPNGKGLVTMPKKLKSSGIKRLMERALWGQGIRKKLENGKRRHEFQADHGLRKWFKTRCELAGMKSINVETLMGHSLGISDSYYKVTSSELLSEYLKVVEWLTLDENYNLKTRLSELSDKNNDDNYSIKVKLQEKDDQIKVIQKQLQFLLSTVCDIENQPGKNQIAKKLIDNEVYIPQ